MDFYKGFRRYFCREQEECSELHDECERQKEPEIPSFKIYDMEYHSIQADFGHFCPPHSLHSPLCASFVGQNCLKIHPVKIMC